jgi:uncharacterized protein YrrD
MRRGSDLVGLPVVTFDTGEQFVRIEDLIFDQTQNRLLGFVVDEGGWFSGARVLPLNRVQTIGRDTIIVPSRTSVIPADTDPTIRGVLERNNILKGTRIVTTDGRELGTLVDLYFDEQTGVVEGYEASGGVYADTVSGRSFIPAPQALKIGQDVAFVPPETAQLMEEQAGRSSPHETQDTPSIADREAQMDFVIGRSAERDVIATDGTLLVARGQVVSQAAAEAAEQRGLLQDLYLASGGRVMTSLQRAFEQTRGRRVQRAVATDQGLIIAAPGQIVTDQVVDRARTYNKEAELVEAVGLHTVDDPHTVATGMGDALAQGTENFRENTTNLWTRFRSNISESQANAAREAEEERIKYAVGRPTTRVILDRQDNIILNVGELITHEAVNRARLAGVLDMLLTSVYDKDPELSQHELRAPEPGEASLEEQHNKTIGA